MELTGHNKHQTSKSLKQLLNMNLVTKNGNYRPLIIGINKDYDSWKELPKMVTSRKIKGSQKSQKIKLPKTVTQVTKNGNLTKSTPLYKLENKRTVDLLYDFYKKEIKPLRKSSGRAKENILYCQSDATFL